MDAQNKEGSNVNLSFYKSVDDLITEHIEFVGNECYDEESFYLLIGKIKKYSDFIEEQKIY